MPLLGAFFEGLFMGGYLWVVIWGAFFAALGVPHKRHTPEAFFGNFGLGNSDVPDLRFACNPSSLDM